MACVNLVFPPRKLNSNGTLQRNKRGFNAAFSHWTPSVSIVQFTVQMSKLNGLGKTHRECKFVVELKLKLRSLFYHEQIVWENSDIKWIKVTSFSLTVTKYFTFQLSMYFLWTIKVNCRRFLGRLSTNVIDTIAYTNSFWNQYSSVDQSGLRQRKQRIHKLFIGLR